MIQIGTFQFPESSTSHSTQTVEAKSKVRKEIHIQSMIEEVTNDRFESQLQMLRQSVERFDRKEAYLSLIPGRFYYGRRRLFRITTDSANRLAFIQGLLLTDDRFERSLTQHQIEVQTYFGHTSFSAMNMGNWTAWPKITIVPEQPITKCKVFFNEDCFELAADMAPGVPIAIDAENRTIESGGNNLFNMTNQNLPLLQPGENRFRLDVEPMESDATCLLQYRDVWA